LLAEGTHDAALLVVYSSTIIEERPLLRFHSGQLDLCLGDG
jgi:hypothetical protein